MRPRLILSIPVSIKEEAWLENGIIIESFYQRKVNGSTTLIRKTILNDDKYESVAGKETTHIKQYPLKNNILSMFTHEPVGITEVYSNSMAAMLPLKKLRHGVYEVIFPNGNRNVYHYQDNICNKILFDHNLFKAEVNLKSVNKL